MSEQQEKMNFPDYLSLFEMPFDLAVCLRMKLVEEVTYNETPIEYTHCLFDNEMTEQIESHMQSTRLCQNQSTSDNQGWIYCLVSCGTTENLMKEDLHITNQFFILKLNLLFIGNVFV